MIKLSPSLMCSDLCNVEKSVNELSRLNANLLHIDIVDGYFSPSMPIGLDLVRCLRKKTNVPFDVHVMAKENDFFIEELIDIGVEQLSFHCESEMHIDRMLKKIKKNGIKAGIALNPSTPVRVLEYALETCDYILLMLINPGYAEEDDEVQVPYAVRKIRDCSDFIRRNGCEMPIEIDGRISIDRIPEYICAGAEILVLGRTSLFEGNSDLEDNYRKVLEAVRQGLDRKSSNELA